MNTAFLKTIHPRGYIGSHNWRQTLQLVIESEQRARRAYAEIQKRETMRHEKIRNIKKAVLQSDLSHRIHDS